MPYPPGSSRNDQYIPVEPMTIIFNTEDKITDILKAKYYNNEIKIYQSPITNIKTVIILGDTIIGYIIKIQDGYTFLPYSKQYILTQTDYLNS